MEPLLEGFSSELQKLAAKIPNNIDKQQKQLMRDLRSATRKADKGSPWNSIRGKSTPRQRDYFRSALIAAAAYPAIGLMSAALGRGLRNRSLVRAMSGAGKEEIGMLASRLERQPLIGSHASRLKPLVSHEDLAAQAGRGLVVGSVLQAVRDRLSGSTKVQ